MSNYSNLLKQLANLEALEKKSRLPATKKVSANLKKELKEAETAKGFSLLTEEDRKMWQHIYNTVGTEAFRNMGINVQIDPLTQYSKRPKVSLVQERNAKKKYNAYVAQLKSEFESEGENTPRPVTPPKSKPNLTSYLRDDYFRGGRKHTRKQTRRTGCRFTRKH